MALSCQVDYAVNLLGLHQGKHALKVADIHLYELIVGLTLNVAQIIQIARISKLIQVYYVVVRVFVNE